MRNQITALATWLDRVQHNIPDAVLVVAFLVSGALLLSSALGDGIGLTAITGAAIGIGFHLFIFGFSTYSSEGVTA